MVRAFVSPASMARASLRIARISKSWDLRAHKAWLATQEATDWAQKPCMWSTRSDCYKCWFAIDSTSALVHVWYLYAYVSRFSLTSFHLMHGVSIKLKVQSWKYDLGGRCSGGFVLIRAGSTSNLIVCNLSVYFLDCLAAFKCCWTGGGIVCIHSGCIQAQK